MSRSRRKPYASVTGHKSVNKPDRTMANRNVRRRQNEVTNKALTEDWDNLLIPDQLECSHNDPWGWASDGLVHYVSKGGNRWNIYPEPIHPESRYYKYYVKYLEEVNCGPNCYWRKVQRK